MNSNDNGENLKKNLKTLTSTFKVISDDLKSTAKTEKNKNTSKFDFLI